MTKCTRVWHVGPLLLLLAGGILAACKPSPPAEPERDQPAQLLLVGDPFAFVLERMQPTLRKELNTPVNFDIERYSDTRRIILNNSRDHHSFYNLVSFDSIWLPRLAQEQALSPITQEDLDRIGVNLETFYPASLSIARWDGVLYGLPIQPHFELLLYREDWFTEKGWAPPKNFDELLSQARAFHDPANERYGICWNGLRGQALGQTISHLYAAFGQPIVGADGEVHIDTETGVQVANYLKELVKVSPPDILNMAWDQRIQRFQSGQAAFTYGWGARSMALEYDPVSQVKGKVGYSVPPGVDDTLRLAPFGQWNLGIPSNLSPSQRDRSLELLRRLFEQRTYDYFLESGLVNPYQIRPESSQVESDYLTTSEMIFEENLISKDARPKLERWSTLADILGIRFHDILLGRLSTEEGLSLAQSEVDEQLILPNSSE